MANIYTVASGNASSTAVWNGGVVPASGDRVLISAGHTVTVTDTREWGDDSTATVSFGSPSVSTAHSVTVAGTLAFSASANTQLTINGSLNFTATGALEQGTKATPIPITYTSKLLLNKSAALADRKYGVYFVSGSKFSIWGATKKRFAKLASNVSAGVGSITVDDATGWRVGDEIYLASTGIGDTQEHEMFFIHSSYTNDSTTVPLANSGGTAVNTAFAHLAPAPVGNLTSNVNVTAYNKTYRPIGLATSGSACLPNNRSLGYCTIEAFGRWDDQTGWTWVNDANYSTVPWKQAVSEVTGAVFVSRTTDAPLYHQLDFYDNPVPYSGSFFIAVGTGQYVMPARVTGYAGFTDCLFGGAYMAVETKETTVFNACFFAQQNKQCFIVGNSRGVQLIGCRYSGQHEGGAIAAAPVGGTGPTDMLVSNCDVTETFPARNKADAAFSSSVIGGGLTVTCKDTYFGTCPAMDFTRIPSMTSVSYVKVINKNRDITLQEEWVRTGLVDRENTVKFRSTSSMRMKPSVANAALKKTTTIAVANGETLRIIGYCRYDATYYNGGTGFSAPTMTLSGTINGVTLTPVTYTAPSANAGNWDLIDKSITNTSGAPGEITVTFSAQTPVVNGLAYFDGIVVSPFVVAARHYGFVFDDANPKRLVNNAISASFSTADAYTGITITWGSTSTVALGASKTFQQVYDYSQAKGVQNLTSAMPLTGSGAAGNVSLTALGNVTTTGYTLNGSGSISMGSFTLTGSIPWTYTYTGGTFAQASTVPSFTGGQLNIGAAGTYTFGMSSGIVSMTPTTPGTYGLGAGTFAGTIDLRNTSAVHAITVQVPAGTTTTTANNTGAAITVSAPSVTQGLNFTGLVAGSQVVVFAAGSQTELFRANTSGTSETWSQAGGFDTAVDYTIFKDGYLPIRVTGITVNSAVVGVPVQQAVDPVYITPAGLTWSTTASVNKVAKTFGLGAASTGQNWYSFMVQQWRQQATLQNVDFPLTTNGPNSIRLLRGWEFSGGLSNWTRDGLAYFNTSGVRTAAWAAVLTSGTAAGHQVRYLQSDGGSFVNAASTGPMDQLVQVYGDASHGNFDRTGFLVVKIQKEGFDQAEADIYGTYGALEDQLYVVGLQAVPNGVAASSTARTITITDSPVTWNGKVFSLAIDATGLTGTQLMQWLRYSFAQAGSFQGKPTFNWHDLVQTNGAKFKTVRGVIHGDASSALKGVRVLASGAAHPDFDTFTADDGTTYSPPVTQSFTVDGLVSGSYVQVYDVTNSAQLAIGTSTTSFTWVDSGAATGDRQIRLRVAYCSGATAKEFIEVANAGTCGTTAATANKSYTVAQKDDVVYNANAIAGSGVTGITISDAIDRMQINIAGGTVSWRAIYAYNVYWLSTAAGIVDDGSIITAKDQANYSVTLFKIKNTSATPLKITQGWGVDSTTGTVEDIIDTTGGNIYPVVDHVVSSVVSVGGANIITGDIADIPAAVWAHNIP